MFYKLLNFILVYILSVINFAIILSPLLFFIIPVMITNSPYIKSSSILTIVLLTFFIVSCLMIFIMFLDYLFGFSSRHYIKGTKEYTKIKNYDAMTDIFEDIKLYFNRPNVKLMILNSTDVNAFAIGNMKKQYVVLTTGLITQYLMENPNRNDFLKSMKCIIGHEMSHLINKDYLPGLLLKINEMATNFISNIILQVFQIIINILSYVPIVGRIIAGIILNLYKLLDFIISFFYKYIILVIYKFIQLKISREREFRCDLQSAMVNGGENMAKALMPLGENGYVTIFSTHPKTSARVNRVKDVISMSDIIRPEKGNSFINFLSIMFILFLPLIIYRYMDIKGLVENYNDIVSHIKFSIVVFKINFNNFFKIH